MNLPRLNDFTEWVSPRHDVDTFNTSQKLVEMSVPSDYIQEYFNFMGVRKAILAART